MGGQPVALQDKTHFGPLLERTERAVRQMMRLFPDHWDCECNRHEAERARMLLPLAWLVRVQDTPEHRHWLRQVAQYILDSQDASGAIRQKVTGGEVSNQQYGAGEAPLIHATGDPCTDLLYTTNFAFLGLREAAAASGDPDLKKAEDRLADFLSASRFAAICRASWTGPGSAVLISGVGTIGVPMPTLAGEFGQPKAVGLRAGSHRSSRCGR